MAAKRTKAFSKRASPPRNSRDAARLQGEAAKQRQMERRKKGFQALKTAVALAKERQLRQEAAATLPQAESAAAPKRPSLYKAFFNMLSPSPSPSQESLPPSQPPTLPPSPPEQTAGFELQGLVRDLAATFVELALLNAQVAVYEQKKALHDAAARTLKALRSAPTQATSAVAQYVSGTLEASKRDVAKGIQRAKNSLDDADRGSLN
mmetsp:Transcript_74101/g.123785  ORF Transcript_74101/g.123785 Transcript_74101/m.123785 type:complete len:207 (+) Transcript_74101:160-780(+)